MTDKYQPLRNLLARVNGEDTDDCFEAYLKWRNTFDVEHCKALLAERDALREALETMVYCHGHNDDELFNVWVQNDDTNQELDEQREDALAQARAALSE